jgi:hypothetical protein
VSDVAIPQEGPCVAWITGDEVADCCSAASGTDPSVFDTVALEASMLLYELSGRKYSGGCDPITVRPCRQPCNAWLGAGYPGQWYWSPWEGNWGWWTDAGGAASGPLCGCGVMPRVKLSGYPVTEIVEVLIDGQVVDPATYRLDNYRFLTRLGYNDDQGVFQQRFWPVCQNLTLNDTSLPGTFAVTYAYGVAPPLAGVEAAKQLACQLYLACSGQECVLPQGVTKVDRQGVTIERALMATWAQTITARGIKSGAWGTGMALVDAFLSTYNPGGLRRRPLIFSPDVQQYAQKFGS